MAIEEASFHARTGRRQVETIGVAISSAGAKSPWGSEPLWPAFGGAMGAPGRPAGRYCARRPPAPPPRGLPRPNKAAGKFDLRMPTEGLPLQIAVKYETPASVGPPKWPLRRPDPPPLAVSTPSGGQHRRSALLGDEWVLLFFFRFTWLSPTGEPSAAHPITAEAGPGPNKDET